MVTHLTNLHWQKLNYYTLKRLYDTQTTALSSYPKNLNIFYGTLAMAKIPFLMIMRHKDVQYPCYDMV
jgi:hypothetical protein